MKTKLIMLFLAIGVGYGCKKESGLNEKEVIETINQEKAETTVKAYCKIVNEYKPVSFGKLKGNVIEHTFKAVGNNIGTDTYDKEYTATYIFTLNNELSEVIDSKQK